MFRKKLLLIKLEIKKCLNKKLFWFVECFACTLAVITSVMTYIKIYIPNQERRLIILEETENRWMMYHEWFENGILEGWLGCNVFLPYNVVFFLLFPLLAAVPYGRSLHYELNSGYAKQIFVKCKRSDYFISKYIAVFISGGIAVGIPLLVGLVTSACCLPAVGIDPLSLRASVAYHNLWSDLYFEKPVLYALIYIMVDFVYGGLFACLALAVSGWCINGFIAVTFPFVLNTAFTKVISINSVNMYSYVAGNFINPAQVDCSHNFMTIVVVAFFMFVICTAIYWINNRKYELFT